MKPRHFRVIKEHGNEFAIFRTFQDYEPDMSVDVLVNNDNVFNAYLEKLAYCKWAYPALINELRDFILYKRKLKSPQWANGHRQAGL